MAIIQKVKINNEWVPVSGSNINSGGGITEEKEVYIGSEEPPVGAKVWIDPQGTPSQPSQPSAGVEVIDNLESDSTTAALSANQGRVLKEMIGQGGKSTKIITVYTMPAEAIEMLSTQMGITLEALPFYPEMCERNALAFSQIAQGGDFVCHIDNRTYFAKVLQPDENVLNVQSIPAQVVYSEVDFMRGKVERDCVKIHYESTAGKVFYDQVLLYSDGTFTADSVLRDVIIAAADYVLTDADKKSNKFIYDNWEQFYRGTRFLREVLAKEQSYASTSCPILGTGFLSSIFTIRNSALCRVTISSDGNTTISPV